jgi:4-amino-4-deoxy-L-arabinose transferase-like glycosyltransferase
VTQTKPAPVPVRERRAPRDRDSVVSTGLIVGLVLAGIAVRIWILRSPLGRPDSDEAVVGLMADAMRHGHFSIYFWGQSYGGTIEPALVAVVYALTGVTSVGMKLVAIVLNAVACVVVWRVGRRTVGPTAAVFAAALSWVFPPAFVWASTKERGFYQVGLILVLLAVLFALRLAEQARTTGRLRVPDLLALGFVTGLAVWTSPHAFFVLAPIGAWLAYRARAQWKQAWPVVPAGLVGGALWFVYVAEHGRRAFSQPTIKTSYAVRVEHFFTELAPRAFGARIPSSPQWLGGDVVGATLFVLAVALFAYGLIGYLRDPSHRRAVQPLLVVVIVYPFATAIARLAASTDEPRYLTFLAPFVLLLVGAVASSVRARVTIGVLAVAVTVVYTGSMIHYVHDHPLDVNLGAPRLQPLEHFLTEHHIDRAFADYWIAYRLTLDTDNHIKASPVVTVRNPQLAAAARSRPNSVYILYRGDAYDRGFPARLRRAGIGYRRSTVGRYAVYELEGRADPKRFESLWLSIF